MTMHMRFLALSLVLAWQIPPGSCLLTPTTAWLENFSTAAENYGTVGRTSNLVSLFAPNAVVCLEGNCGSLASVFGMFENAFDEVIEYDYLTQFNPGYGSYEWSLFLRKGMCKGVATGNSLFHVRNDGKISLWAVSPWDEGQFTNTFLRVTSCGSASTAPPPPRVPATWSAATFKAYGRATEKLISSNPSVFNEQTWLNFFAPSAQACYNSVCGTAQMVGGMFRKRWDAANANHEHLLLDSNHVYGEFEYFIENRGCRAFLTGKMYLVLNASGKITRVVYLDNSAVVNEARRDVLDTCRMANPNCPGAQSGSNGGSDDSSSRSQSGKKRSWRP